MGEFIDRYEAPAESAVTAAWYRILGQSSLPFSINEFIKFVEEEVAGGKFGGVIEWKRKGGVLIWFKWKNVNISATDVADPILAEFHIWGKNNGKNVIITRSSWYKMYLVRSNLEDLLERPRWSLTVRSRL